MTGLAFWNERRIAGALLVVGFLILMGGVYFFMVTQGDVAAPVTQSRAGVLKANLVSLGMVVTALGLATLETALRDAGDRILSRLGMVAFVMGAGLWLVAESLSLDGRGWVYPLERDYLLLSCFSIACFGGALLRTRLLPQWVGWVGLAWGAVGLGVGLVTFLPPLWANPAQLVVGIALLAQKRQVTEAAEGKTLQTSGAS